MRIREFETTAAIEACLAMMHNKVPTKKTVPRSFTIPCSIGNNYSTKALCDPGASINLIPKSIFQKLGIGEAKPTTVMLNSWQSILRQKRVCHFLGTRQIINAVRLHFDTTYPLYKPLPSLSLFTLLLPPSSTCSFSSTFSQTHSHFSEMVGEFSARFADAAADERYAHIVILKNIWEEQRFKQPARANINYVREFYAHNASRDKEKVHVQGRMVLTDTDTINKILDLPESQPNIYDHINALEDIDFNTIKDVTCQPGTKWNTTGRNPGAISRPNLLSEAKLCNTIVKRNLMPTSHNQMVDHKRLVIIHSPIFSNKFNVEEVIARELFEACKNNKGILAFPCLISALYRQHGVPTYNNNQYTDFLTGWDRKHYLKKMDVADAIPIKVAMPTPAPAVNPETPADSDPTTPPTEPQRSPSIASADQGSFAATPTPTPPKPQADPQPSPAHSTEVPPLYIM
ncbi:hypothetical protein V6N12_010386 [Hibiscus sabdariffa]|uniref:Putative plant transposon protein domain-containing protein n=1 Tax=Hibiscus sabdariffa TaxID=183260 RepID=A0ABR2EJX9_9ROSI